MTVGESKTDGDSTNSDIDDEQRWYYYNRKAKKSQWDLPPHSSPSGIKHLFSRTFLRSRRRSGSPSGENFSSQAMDATTNDEELARILQEEEYGQEPWTWPLSPSSQPNECVDYNEPGPSSAMNRPGNEAPQNSQASTQGLECGICMDDDDPHAERTWLECAHQFHTKCVQEWLKTANRCPICRMECTV